MNEAAKKIVARVARAAAKELAERVRLGANVDELTDEAWRQERRDLPFQASEDSERYFAAVFQREIVRQ